MDRFGGKWLTGTPRGELPIYKQPPDSPLLKDWTPPPPRSPRMQRLADTEDRWARGCFPWFGGVGAICSMILVLAGVAGGDLNSAGVGLVLAAMFGFLLWVGVRMRAANADKLEHR
jgi:hypothetical protein